MTDAEPILRYADRFHRALPPGHQVASPLGAWLLLALVAPVGELTDVLGTDHAADTARNLLEHPHPLVGSAAALWTAVDSDALRAWRDGLPAPVARGTIPSQRDADAWARRNTLELIDRFPLDLTPETVLVLATALATKVSWTVPFALAPAGELASARWPALTQVLRIDAGHDMYLASTAAGPVAVHEAYADGGLRVRSVIADASVPALDVLASAYRPLDRMALTDLPLGAGFAWTIEEGSGSGGDRYTAVLPAWSASSIHDLADPAFGMAAAAQALSGLLPPDDYSWDAAQSAVARYSREGFEAAAVTAMAMRASAMMPQPDARHRRATLRFGHPYAVVAFVDDTGSAWHGLPVFSAWVAEPEDAA